MSTLAYLLFRFVAIVNGVGLSCFKDGGSRVRGKRSATRFWSPGASRQHLPPTRSCILCSVAFSVRHLDLQGVGQNAGRWLPLGTLSTVPHVTPVVGNHMAFQQQPLLTTYRNPNKHIV